MTHASVRDPPALEPIAQHLSHHCRLFASQRAPGPWSLRCVIGISGPDVSAHRLIRAKRNHIVGQAYRLRSEIPTSIGATDPIHDRGSRIVRPKGEARVDRPAKYRRGGPALERSAIRCEPPFI